MRHKIPTLVGSVLLMGSVFLLFLLDLPLHNGQLFTFSAAGEAPIAATYHPGTRDAGVMLLSGFGADQVMMRAIAAEFARDGVHVLTFDYPGQGRTGGGLGFDNAATDRLANLTQRAMQVFMQKSGLDARRILWVGHSLGARVALQSSVLGPLRPAGLVLMGAQINLGYNAQSEFFTGVSDADLDWVQALDSRTPPIPILLVSGTWEDILTVDAATLLMNKLCPAQTTAIPNHGCYSTFPRAWLLFDKLVHNYEVYSPRVIRASLKWSADLWGLSNLPNNAAGAGWRIAVWIIAACGMFTTLGGLLPQVRTRHPESPGDYGIRIYNPGRWLWGKALLWLAALPVAVILMIFFLFIPLNSPTFNLIYVGFIGGYALLMVVLYRMGRVPGVAGKLSLPQRTPRVGWQRWALAAAFNLLVFGLLTGYFNSGQGLVPPVGERLAWLVIFTPLTALGFWLGMIEIGTLVRDHPEKSRYLNWAIVIGLFPFILRAALLAALASTSGMLGAVTGLVIFALVILQGEVTRILTCQPLLAAVIDSVLLYWLLLPSGPLFLPFF